MWQILLQITYFASWVLIWEALLQRFLKLSVYIMIKTSSAEWEMEKYCFKPFTSKWRQLLANGVLTVANPTGELGDFCAPRHTSPLNKGIYCLFLSILNSIMHMPHSVENQLILAESGLKDSSYTLISMCIYSTIFFPSEAQGDKLITQQNCIRRKQGV